MGKEDKIVLASLKKGDIKAFDVLFKKYSSRLYFFALHFFTSKTDAEEIVQETFVKIWETRERIDENQHFNTYLIAIAKHIIYNHFRHKLVERKYSEQVKQSAVDFYSIEEDIAIKNLRSRMLAGMAQLPPQQREILHLRHKGYDNDEIARQLKISKRTVETHIGKAFKYLRIQLQDYKEFVFIIFIIKGLGFIFG